MILFSEDSLGCGQKCAVNICHESQILNSITSLETEQFVPGSVAFETSLYCTQRVISSQECSAKLEVIAAFQVGLYIG